MTPHWLAWYQWFCNPHLWRLVGWCGRTSHRVVMFR